MPQWRKPWLAQRRNDVDSCISKNIFILLGPIRNTNNAINVLIIAGPNNHVAKKVKANDLVSLLRKYIFSNWKYSVDDDKTFESSVLSSASVKTNKDGNVWLHKDTGQSLFILYEDLVVRFCRLEEMNSFFDGRYRAEYDKLMSKVPDFSKSVNVDVFMSQVESNSEREKTVLDQKIHMIDEKDEERMLTCMAIEYRLNRAPKIKRPCVYIPFEPNTSLNRYFGPISEHLKRCLDADLAVIDDGSMRWVSIIKWLPLYTYGFLYDLEMKAIYETEHFTFARRHGQEITELRFQNGRILDCPMFIVDGMSASLVQRSKHDISRGTLLFFCMTFIDSIVVSSSAPGSITKKN